MTKCIKYLFNRIVLPFPLKMGEIATCLYNEILWGGAGGDNPG